MWSFLVRCVGQLIIPSEYKLTSLHSFTLISVFSQQVFTLAHLRRSRIAELAQCSVLLCSQHTLYIFRAPCQASVVSRENESIDCYASSYVCKMPVRILASTHSRIVQVVETATVVHTALICLQMPVMKSRTGVYQ